MTINREDLAGMAKMRFLIFKSSKILPGLKNFDGTLQSFQVLWIHGSGW